MKKIILISLSILIVLLFVVGCIPKETTIEDEEGNIIGQGIRVSSSSNKLKTEVDECKSLEGKCGFLNEGQVVDAVLTVLNKCFPYQIDPPFKPEGYTCNDRCAEIHKRCVFGSRFQINVKADRVDGLVACDSPIDKKATSIFYHCSCC